MRFEGAPATEWRKIRRKIFSPLLGCVDPLSIVHALAGLLLISISRPPWTEHVAAGF
jgi:hypothetical protein